MTEEEIRPIAEDYVEEYCHCPDGEYTDGSLVCAGIGTALIVSRQLEKRIAELEHQLTHRNCLDCSNHSSKLRMRTLELKKENAELRKIAEFQQSSNMSRHFENKKLKEGLAVGSTFNKALNSMNKALEEERDKYRDMVFDKNDQLTKAKEIIKAFLDSSDLNIKHKAEEFLGEF